MHRRFNVLAFVLLAAVLLLPAVAAAAPAKAASMSYDQAVDYLFTTGYPQNIETYLANLGTSPLGYRLAGTPSDNAAARYIADKLRAMGLAVRLEKVPVDVWDVRGASLTVGDATYTCSQFAGVPGVDRPLTAEVVYLHSGLAADYEGVDVGGKIVMVDSSLDNFWLNIQGAEATRHGAAAVVLTSNYSDPDPAYPSFPWYSWASDALGGNDGEYDMSWAPMIYLSQKDGDTLKSALAAAAPKPVEATFASEVHITMADDGGVGYNVVATLRGRAAHGQKVVLNAHHDSHLRAGLDDTGAVAETLAMAKAMTMSRFRPKRDVVFLFDTAEEFGYTNAWYDWSVGAWYFITHEHPEWAGHIVAVWSIELMAREGAPLEFNTSPELASWLASNAEAAKAAALLPDYSVKTPQSTWQNGWSFQGMGVPSFEVTAGGKDYDLMYHSTYEVPSELDWDYMADIDHFFFDLFQSMDTPEVPPYDFAARGADLMEAVDTDELQAAGVSARAADKLETLAARIKGRGETWNALRSDLRGHPRSFARMLAPHVAGVSLKGYQALDAWDYSCYPHQQTMWDIQNMDAALAHLKAGPAEAAAAKESLAAVGINWWATLFSPSVIDYELTRHDPEYYRVTWGAMGKQVIKFDMSPVWALIDAGQYDKAIARVQKMRDADALDLRKRVDGMIAVSRRVESALRYLDRAALRSNKTRAKDAAVKEGIHTIQVGIQSWAVDHGDKYPPVSIVNAKGFASYVDHWPTNPYTGVVMRRGTGRGNYTYRTFDGGKHFRLMGQLSNGRFVVP